MARIIKDIYLALLNLVYPKFCQGCGVKLHFKNNLYLCKSCEAKVELNHPPFCIKCGRPITGEPDLKAICGECTGKRYSFDMTFSCCRYEGLIKKLIHNLKYGRKKFLIYPLGRTLYSFSSKYIDLNAIDYIIPVPLHRGRAQERGFNQTLLLAEDLSKRADIKINHNNLIKQKATRQQVHLDKKQRLNNIKGAFKVKRAAQFKDKNLILLDDVFTTGATANECAGLLKQAGARNIFLLTLARGG